MIDTRVERLKEMWDRTEEDVPFDRIQKEGFEFLYESFNNNELSSDRKYAIEHMMLMLLKQRLVAVDAVNISK